MKSRDTSVSVTQLGNNELLVNITCKLPGLLKQKDNKVVEASRKEVQKYLKKIIENVDFPAIGVSNEDT